jgi:hypothetical protein
MRNLLITALAAVTALPLRAQDSTITIRARQRGAGPPRVAVQQLPPDVADQVVAFFNAGSTVRLSGQTLIPAGRGVDGDVAVLGGPVTVAGRVAGSLLIVNGDLQLDSGAVVQGDVTVVGGAIAGASRATIAGSIRSFHNPIRYRRVGDGIARATRPDFWPTWLRPHADGLSGNQAGFDVSFGGIYNRVEGLPLLFGPNADLRLGPNTRLQADARGIFRTAGDWSLSTGDFGYRARTELVLGTRDDNVGLGLRAYDVVNSVQQWPLKDFEVGWATFFFHRDYRDYFRRRGAGLFATLRTSRQWSFTLEGRSETQSSVAAREPFTLFRSGRLFPPNPPVNGGKFRVLTATLRYDTRNDLAAPTAGYFAAAEWELGHGTDVAPCALPDGACLVAFPAAPGTKLSYARILFDLRSYTRISPSGRLNVRLAGGGWAGGDPLPLQRRVGLGYPDPLPGYGFGQFNCGGQTAPGTPALCDRVLAGQVEFRTHLGLDIGPEWASSDWSDDQGERYEPFHVSGPDLVVFADAGRSWLVGEGPGRIPAGKLPTLGSFKTDLGLGLDFGPLGVYLAKPLGRGANDVTFSVRMGRRF